MAEEDNLGEEIKALTGQLSKTERAITALTAAQSASIGAPSLGQGSAPSMGTYQSTAPNPPRFSNYNDRANFVKALGAGFVGSSMGLVNAVATALPTTQEAVDMQALAARMRFYGGGTGYSARGKLGGAYQTDTSAMAAQLATSYQGTALSPEDAAQAVNSASQKGLLPGLPNFGIGKNNTGILGSAALASNLAPGLGLAGGVGIMASLNDPRNINMARMFGLQFRNKQGTGMIDLAQIIDQLYTILSKAGPVTKENIAISVMPGNSLDSILNQYFGLDPNLRNVIISGLIQKASGEPLTKSGIEATGGLTTGISSTSMRATAEMNLLQQFSASTVKNLIGANNVLNNIYGGLVNKKNDTTVKDVQAFSTNLETLGGARNGAGQILIDSMFDTAGALVSLPGLGKLAGVAALGAAGKKGWNALKTAGLFSPTTKDPFKGQAMVQSGVAASNPGQMFTGAITINVSAPLGQDPFSFASAITSALGASM